MANSKYGYGRGVGEPICGSKFRLSRPVWKAVIIAALVMSIMLFWQPRHPHIGEIPNLPTQTPLSNPKRPRIAIATFVTGQHSYIYLSLKNKYHYANRHGYDMIVDYEYSNSRHIMYHKFAMIERVIKAGKHDWIWWMDFDTLITNTDVRLEEVIDDGLASVNSSAAVDFLLTNDCNKLNAGSFITRSSPTALDFFEQLRTYHDRQKRLGKDGPNDQEVILEVTAQNETLAQRVTYMPQWTINAFPEEIKCYDDDEMKWQHGMFVIHFAGAWAHLKEEDPTGYLMKKYEGKIIWGQPVPDE